MFTKYSIVALFAGLAAAYHAPVGEPTGNAITSPLVEVGSPSLKCPTPATTC